LAAGLAVLEREEFLVTSYSLTSDDKARLFVSVFASDGSLKRTVPISGDSISVMAVPVPGSERASMLAATQPAVPPPTIAMLLIRLPPAGLRASDRGAEAMC